MNPRHLIVTNVRYQSTRGRGANQLAGLLRYIRYRPDVGGEVSRERWVDKGLGPSYLAAAASCSRYRSKHVQAFSWVIAPNPLLMALVSENQHDSLVAQVAEAIVDETFAALERDTPEYAYAVHHREVSRANGRMSNPHAHVILPGTVFSWPDRARLAFYMNRCDIDQLHEISGTQMQGAMQRYVGFDWEARANVELQGQLASLMREAVDGREHKRLPNGDKVDDKTSFLIPAADMDEQLWIAIRRTGDKHDVGLRIERANQHNPTDIVYVPLIRHLSRKVADLLSASMHAEIVGNPEQGIALALRLAFLLDGLDSREQLAFLNYLSSSDVKLSTFLSESEPGLDHHSLSL